MLKQGTMQDIFFMIVVLTGLAIFIAIMAYTIPRITNEMRETELNESSAVRVALLSADDNTVKFDYIYLFVFFGLCIAVLITSFLIGSHPIFLPIYIFLLAFAVIVGVIMNNAYEEFSTNSVLNETIANQTFTTTIMDNFVVMIIAVGILSMIITFGKAKFSGREGM